MKAMAILSAALLAVACETSSTGTATVVGSLAPSTTTLRLSIAPSPLSLVPLTLSCELQQRAFSTTFDLVVVPASPAALDRVTLRLIDGSSVGGPTLTFPRPQLVQMFGSTSLDGP